VFRFVKGVLDNDSLKHIAEHWINENLSHRHSNKLRVPFTRSSYLKKFPNFDYPVVFNKHIDLFNSRHINKNFKTFRSIILKNFATDKKCRIRNCYICIHYNVCFSLKQAEIRDKIERIKILIAKKAAAKAERYQRLCKKAGINQHNHLNELIEL